MPSVLPFSTEKLTPSTAPTMPSSVRKYVFRSLTSRSAMRSPIEASQPDPRVDDGVEQVDDRLKTMIARGEHDRRP